MLVKDKYKLDISLKRLRYTDIEQDDEIIFYATIYFNEQKHGYIDLEGKELNCDPSAVLRAFLIDYFKTTQQLTDAGDIENAIELLFKELVEERKMYLRLEAAMQSQVVFTCKEKHGVFSHFPKHRGHMIKPYGQYKEMIINASEQNKNIEHVLNYLPMDLAFDIYQEKTNLLNFYQGQN